VALVCEARRSGTTVSVLVLDVDRLKSLNDRHGHLAGADAVRLVGHILATHMRPPAISCRFGGDEFVVAVPGRAPADLAAHHIRHAVHAASPTLSGTSVPAATLSVSIALASANFRGDDTDGQSLDRAATRKWPRPCSEWPTGRSTRPRAPAATASAPQRLDPRLRQATLPAKYLVAAGRRSPRPAGVSA